MIYWTDIVAYSNRKGEMLSWLERQSVCRLYDKFTDDNKLYVDIPYVALLGQQGTLSLEVVALSV